MRRRKGGQGRERESEVKVREVNDMKIQGKEQEGRVEKGERERRGNK